MRKFFQAALIFGVLYFLGFTLCYIYNNCPGVFGILGWIVGPVVLVIWVAVVTVVSYRRTTL